MKQVMILGASGFIGFNAVKYFASIPEFQVTAVINKRPFPDDPPKNVTIFQRDLLKRDEVRGMLSCQPDIILQFAASTTNITDCLERPYLHVTDNILINTILFEEAHNANIKHIVFPSCTTMYKGNSEHIYKEVDFYKQDIQPQYYGVATTKVFIEDLARFWSLQNRTKYTVLRQTNIYGPYDRFNTKTGHVCSAAIKKVIDAKSFVEVWGTGKEKRDLLHVDDLCSLLLKITSDNSVDQYQLLNVGSGSEISVYDLYRKIKEVSKKDITILLNPEKVSPNFTVKVDISKADKLFDWRPTIKLTNGIESTYLWAIENAS